MPFFHSQKKKKGLFHNKYVSQSLLFFQGQKSNVIQIKHKIWFSSTVDYMNDSRSWVQASRYYE